MQEEEEVKVLIGPFGHIRSSEGKGCMVVIRLLLLFPLCSSASTFFLLSSFRPPSTYLPTGLSSLSLSLFSALFSLHRVSSGKVPFGPWALFSRGLLTERSPEEEKSREERKIHLGGRRWKRPFVSQRKKVSFLSVWLELSHIFSACGCEEREESGEEEN